jgi:hypothetical protein
MQQRELERRVVHVRRITMSAVTPYADDVLSALEPGGGLPEAVTEIGAEPLPAFPVGAPPAGKPFRLHPEWAQRGPFW